MDKVKEFFKRKDVEFSGKRYLFDALGAMTIGLFASLLIGTILKTIGDLTGIELLLRINVVTSIMTGPAIAAAVAYALKAPPLVMFSCCTVGAVGYGLTIHGTPVALTAAEMAGTATIPFEEIISATGTVVVGGFAGGGPVGAFVAACVAAEVGKLVSKETKLDILVTPAATILSGVLVGIYLGPPISALMSWLGLVVAFATQQQPVIMGALVAMLMGMALTLPISSAALAVALGLGGIAAGASTVGCATQMVGFAVMSFRENGWGGLAAQGIGTSMLQMPNIIKNWKIWIPPTLASMLIGPLATTVFQMDNIPIGAGMGTSGLVGQIGTIAKMGANPGNSQVMMYLGIVLLHFILPAALTLLIAAPMRRLGWIRDGDLKLDL